MLRGVLARRIKKIMEKRKGKKNGKYVRICHL